MEPPGGVPQEVMLAACRQVNVKGVPESPRRSAPSAYAPRERLAGPVRLAIVWATRLASRSTPWIMVEDNA
jgi:hypothetical protein